MLVVIFVAIFVVGVVGFGLRAVMLQRNMEETGGVPGFRGGRRLLLAPPWVERILATEAAPRTQIAL